MARISDVAIDVGTANVLIYGRGYGMLSSTPAVVAVNRNTGAILKYGQEALDMVGRTPQHILTLYPLREGTIKDYSIASSMLQNFISDAFGNKKRFFSRPRAVISLPSNINEMEQRTLNSALYDAGLGRTYMINRSLAAVIGLNISLNDPTGTMVVDMGGSVTDISVVSMGHVVEHRCIPLGGEHFNEAIIRYLRLRHSLQIGVLTAEKLKIDCTTAMRSKQERFVPVSGRLVSTNLPKRITISTYDLTDAVNPTIQTLVEQIHDVLCHTDAALVSDICMYGIVLSGGPARMPALSDAIGIALNMPVNVAKDVDSNIVLGCSYVLNDIRSYGRYLNDNR